MGAPVSSNRNYEVLGQEADPWGPEHGSGVRQVARSGYTRVRYVIESKVAVLELRPAEADDPRPLSPMPEPRLVDVSGPTHLLADQTLVLCECPGCGREELCSVCFGSRRIEAWLSVRASRSYQVVVHGEGAARERHAECENPHDFDRTEWPNQLLHQAWYRAVPGQLARQLYPRINPDTDRVQWVHVQVFVG